MRYLLLLFLSFISYSSLSQSIYDKADSMVRQYIQELPAEHRSHFDTLLRQRAKADFQESLDKKECTYLYCIEFFCDFTGEFDSDYTCYDTTIEEKETKHLNKLINDSKHVQERKYQKWATSEHDRACRKKHKYKEIEEKEIETTYAIITVINKTTGEISVTLLYPPKKATCHYIYVGGGKC